MPLVRSALEIRSEVCDRAFLLKQSMGQGFGCLLRGAPSLMFDGIPNVTLSEEKVSTTGVTQGNLELLLCPNSPDSHQTQIQEDLGLTPLPHLLEGELIHLIDKAKKV